MPGVTWRSKDSSTVCIVGGGPAGMILALLLARQGVEVTVLEAAGDFARTFRGDTLHPATLELFARLGLARDVLALPHTRAGCARCLTNGAVELLADFACLPTPYPYLAVMPQARLLDFVHAQLQRLPNARVHFHARVEGLLRDGARVTGVRFRTPSGERTLRCALVVGADGRASKVRALAALPLRRLSPGQDVLWCSLPRCAGDPQGSIDLHLHGGHCLVTIDHGERWQVGYSIAKGSYQDARARGVSPLRDTLARAVPWLAGRARELQDWRQLHLLSVEVARAPRWYTDGLLLIGDAAHPISPIGGMGINMAVQDAVAVANHLTEDLRRGEAPTARLAGVQRARAWQIAALQAQQVIQEREVVTIHGGATLHVPMRALRVLHGLPLLRRIPGYVTAYGLSPVRLKPELWRELPLPHAFPSAAD